MSNRILIAVFATLIGSLSLQAAEDLLAASNRSNSIEQSTLGGQAQSGPKLRRSRLPMGHVPPQAYGAVPAASTTYAFTLIDFPGVVGTDMFGINAGATAADQLLVGIANPNSSTTDGFVLGVTTKGGIVRETFGAVDAPIGITHWGLTAINNSGQVVGYGIDSVGAALSYELISGNYTAVNVPFPGAVDTEAWAINNSGDIVGSWDMGGTNPVASLVGFELSGGTYTNLPTPSLAGWVIPYDINNEGEIVGAYSDGFYGFLLHNGTYTTVQVPGSFETQVYGINDFGDMVGIYCPTEACVTTPDDPGTEGFVRVKGVFSTITIPGASYTYVGAISNFGVISGGYTDSAGNDHGFIGVPQN